MSCPKIWTGNLSPNIPLKCLSNESGLVESQIVEILLTIHIDTCLILELISFFTPKTEFYIKENTEILPITISNHAPLILSWTIGLT